MSRSLELHTRALARAIERDGVALTWGAVSFKAVRNALPPVEDGVDRNPGDNVGGSFTALASVFSAGIPLQGDSFTDAAGVTYRIVSKPSTADGSIVFHFAQ